MDKKKDEIQRKYREQMREETEQEKRRWQFTYF